MTEQRFGSYRVVRKLGEGGMGVVYEAIHEEIGKRAAIKVLHSGFSRDPQISARFLTEARAVNLVQHPGLVSIFEFGRSADGSAYMVMEFLLGETLRSRLERVRKLEIADAQRITRQIADALAAAHEQNIVHRDLKPENVMLVPDPELASGERAKILDFGVAKTAQRAGAQMTQAGAFLGTPAYMSPEQCLSAGGVNEKADSYALGVMLFEMLTGDLPFMAEGLAEIMLMHIHDTPPQLRPRVPLATDALVDLVTRMLAKEPDQRPTAREISKAVDMRATSGAPPMAGPLVNPMAAVSSPVVRPVAAAEIGTISSIPFIHRNSSGNTVENHTFIDHPYANGEPNAMLLTTSNWNPGGQGGTYNPHHLGVWYARNGRWSIYNEDLAPMPLTAAFSTIVSKAAFIHRAVPTNIINNWTLLDHPSCNLRPDALLLITPNWNPGGQGGLYNRHALGVWYTQGRWSIYNQDRVAMPPGAAWNVLVSEKTILHRVTQNNLVGPNGSWIEHPSAFGNPNAVVIITSNWNPGGQGGVYHDHPIGVYYCGDRWAIFNQDMAAMPPGVAFNVAIFDM